MESISVFIIEDHNLLRETWVSFLTKEENLRVTGNCGSGELALEMIKENPPNVILLDIKMVPMNGFAVLEALEKLNIGAKVIALSLYSQANYVKKMMAMGAMGYLNKNCSLEELVSAIKEVYRGNKYVSESVKCNIAEEELFGEPAQPNIRQLTPREVEIIHSLKTGESSKDIASALQLSVKTVEVHRHNILKKLGIRNTAALINFFNRNS